MTDNKLVYEFIPTTEYEKPANPVSFGIFFIVIPILVYVLFFLTKDIATCHMNGSVVPCDKLTLPLSVFCLSFAGIGLGIIIYSRFHKTGNNVIENVYRIYEDHMELYGIVVKRENMVDISFSYNIGEKKKKIGSIEIGTNIDIYLDDEDSGDDFILLEDVPNVEDAYFKIKYLYNLPGKKK